jgi:hypothetical protein
MTGASWYFTTLPMSGFFTLIFFGFFALETG